MRGVGGGPCIASLIALHRGQVPLPVERLSEAAGSEVGKARATSSVTLLEPRHGRQTAAGKGNQLRRLTAAFSARVLCPAVHEVRLAMSEMVVGQPRVSLEGEVWAEELHPAVWAPRAAGRPTPARRRRRRLLPPAHPSKR